MILVCVSVYQQTVYTVVCISKRQRVIHADVYGKILHVLHNLQDVTHQLHNMGNLVLSATPGRTDSSCTFLDLTSVEGMPIMPTLSGWMLQYPVVYLAHPDTAVRMAQLLSEAILVLYNVQVAGLLIEVGMQCHCC